MNKKTLFDPCVPDERLHAFFRSVRESPTSEPARWMLDDVYQSYVDKDGNFLEQFQTTGFDARFFELFLHAYFERARILLQTRHAAPDFFVVGDGQEVAVEATTVNPATSGVLAALGKKIGDLSETELATYRRHELAVRYGSPLYSKLQKRYWDLPQCKGRPIVIAIQAFHDEDSLGMADSSLAGYLYGLESAWERTADGALLIEFNRVYSHEVGEKEIPSSFFDQPGAEHISAVLFSNSGTLGKFSRMGYQAGVGNESLAMVRRGFAYNEIEIATDPVFFMYSLDSPPLLETWGQGLVVLHNPRAVRPISFETFPDAAQTILQPDGLHTFNRGWQPFTSHNVTIDVGEAKKYFLQFPGRMPAVGIGFIPEEEYRHATNLAPSSGDAVEDSWFTDESSFFYGVLLRSPDGVRWSSQVLARDQYFVFYVLVQQGPFPDRRTAQLALYESIMALLTKPQRIFHR